MISVIFGQIKDLIGRTYILAGLLPSAVLVVGYYIYSYGRDGLLSLVGKVPTNDAALSPELYMVMLAWLGLGILFVSLRLIILHITVSLPGRILAPLRSYMEARMLRNRKRAWQNKEKTLFSSTVLDWRHKGFPKPKFTPPFIRIPEKASALESSSIARRIVLYLADKRYSEYQIPSHSQTKAIRQGLCNLYSYGSSQQNDPDYDREVKSWEVLAQNELAKEVLQQVTNTIRREHAIALKKYADYPEDLWIKPTYLGNLTSALDDYSERRYGMDTATMFSRLWWIIPDDAKKEVMHAKFQVELLLNLMASFALLALFVITNSVLLKINAAMVDSKLSLIEGLVLFLLLLIFAVFVYRRALFGFLTLKDKTISLIDIHRHLLLKEMGYRPADVKEETDLFRELHAFFVQASPRCEHKKIEFDANG